MKSFFLISGFFLLFLSCSPPIKSIRDNQAALSYQFNYYPYNTINVEDRDLYNTVFNIVRNKLVYLVDKTFPSTSDLIGLVFELDREGRKKEFEDVMKNKYARGWNIFETDAIPFSGDEIDAINSGQIDEKTARLPKAVYFIQKSENKAVIYVRYWLQEYKNNNFIYYLENSGRWSVTGADELN
jgi:hypothetical protein